MGRPANSFNVLFDSFYGNLGGPNTPSPITSRGDFISLYQCKDKTLALAQEYANDAETDYYANKLHKFASRLREAFTEEEFDRLFPKPIPAAKRPDPNQLSMEDLFG